MGRSKFFRKVFDGTQTGQNLQGNIEDAIADLLKNVLIDGRLVENVAIGLGDNTIEHKLARKIKGYIIVKSDALTNTYVTSDDDLFLNLNASAHATVSLWIF